MSRLVQVFGALRERMARGRVRVNTARQRILRPLEVYPTEAFASHFKAAMLFEEGDFESAEDVQKSALAADVCHVDAPIAIFEQLEQSSPQAAMAYLRWFIDQRDAVVFRQIDTYVDSLQNSRYLDYPLIVQIETIALCNAACTFCQYPALERKGDKLPDELIDKILIELATFPKDLPFTLTLYGVSEPFLDKRIYRNIERINAELPNAQLQINTNGTPLTDANIDRLAEMRIAGLGISVNDYRKAEYEKTMQLPFEKTLKVLDSLERARMSGRIPFNVGVTRAGDGSIEDLKFISWVRKNYPSLSSYYTPNFVWVGEASEQRTVAQSVGCAHWYELAIRSTGQVSFCCIDGHVNYPRGDVRSQSLLDIYNMPAFRALRLKKTSRAEVLQCSSCTSG
jgi:hypothetical protein